MTTAAPKLGEVYRVRLGARETLAVVLSCAEANALRLSVVVSELFEDQAGIFRGGALPTVVAVPERSSGLGADLIAYASLYTVPRAVLLERKGSLHPQVIEGLQLAVKRVLGLEPWPT